MTLTLNHSQRLNLVAMLDALECQGRRETWAVCDLQKQIDLSDEERDAIGWRKAKTPDGREYIVWNQNGNLDARQYELNGEDTERIVRAVDNYRVVLVRDRSWWEPLVAQLPVAAESNGNKS